MRSLLSGICIFLLVQTASAQSDTLAYNDPESINWEHYKGNPTNDSSAAETNTFMLVNLVKRNIWTGRVTYRVESVIVQSHSWCFPKYKTDRTLRHERTHLYITRLYASQLQVYLDTHRKLITPEEGNLIYDQFAGNMIKMQKQFDEETLTHNDETEAAWYARVKRMVAEINKNEP